MLALESKRSSEEEGVMSDESKKTDLKPADVEDKRKISGRRKMLLAGTALAGLSTMGLGAPVQQAQ